MKRLTVAILCLSALCLALATTAAAKTATGAGFAALAAKEAQSLDHPPAPVEPAEEPVIQNPER